MFPDRSFEAPDGILLNDLAGVLSGTFNPITSGQEAPLGTLFLRTDGRNYRKTGGLDTDWTETDTGGGSSIDIHSGVDEILTGETFTIEARRQSIVSGCVSIAGSGLLIVVGTLVIIGDQI
jgi:hypothetical protein